MACEGNSKQLCGGAGAVQMYLNLLNPWITFGPPFLVTKYKDWKYLQCTQCVSVFSNTGGKIG